MAKPCTCHNSCWNFSFASKDKHAGATLTKDSSTLTSTPAMSCALIPALATVFAVVLYLDNKLFKYFINAYLEDQISA